MRIALVILAATLLAIHPHVCRAAAPTSSPAAGSAGRFEFRTKRSATTSGGIFDAKGRLIRTLWTVRRLVAGTHAGGWDGRDEFGQGAPRGGYELRVVVNEGTYRNVGIIGNTGNDRPGHTPGTLRSVANDSAGAVYTANGWEEAGADFKKWDRDGKAVFDADFQVRNGNPNGIAYAIAVDDAYLYCSIGGWDRAPFNSRQQVQRFRTADGRHAPFTGIVEDDGHIQLYEWPEKQIPPGTAEPLAALLKSPLRALAVSGATLYVGDALGNKVHAFHKATGRRERAFPVPLPTAIAIAPDGRVWVAHEQTEVSSFAPDGSASMPMIAGLGEIRALAFGPSGRLYVADATACAVKIFDTNGGKARAAGSFGRRARPGDSAPERFFTLEGVAVDRAGALTTIQSLPLGGARLAHWSPRGTLLWEHRGLEFVSLGTYPSRDPDEFLSLHFNRYHLDRRAPLRAEFRGNLFAGDARYHADVHGVPRIVRLGAIEFFYTAQGDGMQVFRRDGDALRPSAMIGGRWPTPDGRRDDRGPLGQWTWHDGNGDGIVDPVEVSWFRRPGAGKYATLGMNVDDQGNILYCDQERRTIHEVPRLGLDGRGNPLYDWARARVVVARDASKAKLTPLMAVRGSEGGLYAFGRSDTWKEPKNNGAWMGGWALSGYDARGALRWATPLPQVCVGMDAIPGGGVVLGWYEKAHVFHYNADGLHIGTATPGPAAGGATGWLDNTAALAANRDPRDSLIDVFTSDNLLYRILWYRIDDRAIETIRVRIVL